MNKVGAAALGVLGMVVAAGGFARPAQACGGFFCSQPPPDGTLPIAQSAENVLFVLDSNQAGGSVEAHIQIFYTGPASEFSWIVPVTAVPTVTVGSDILFDRIEPPTRPSFNVSYVMEGNCRGVSGVGAGCGSAAAGGGDSAGFGPVPGGDGGAGVDVLARGSAGPYEYVVIRSEDGATLRTWLTNNNYFVSPESAAIVDEYVAGQFSFVALRLQRGQDTSAIRPIVLRLASVEACLPLKLTAIAATPDLRINVWVLAAARAVPINYAEIAINQAKLDWFNFGRNYDQLLKEAANEADGNAFAVEYAMPASASVAWFTLPTNARSQLAAAATPPSFVNVIRQLGLPLSGAVLQILRKHVPLPASLSATGLTEAAFYGNIASYWTTNMAAFAPFNAAAATNDMDTEVLIPMDSYRRLFQERGGRLTRLATFISPDEMNSDPVFIANASLPDVAPQHLAVARVMCGDGGDACSSPVRLKTEDGKEIGYRATGCMRYERGNLDQLPAADVAWLRGPDGEGQLVLDNRATIMAAVRAHNETITFPESDDGCGCAMGGSPGIMVVVLAAAGGFALVRRSRRRR
jgi:MYXO-CTERM domain-containing protein